MKAADLDDFITNLQVAEMKSLARYFAKNLERAEDLRYAHFELVFPVVMENRRIKVMTEVIKERLVRKVIGPDDKFTPEFMQEVARRIAEDEEELVKYLMEGAEKYLEAIAERKPTFGAWLRALEQSSVVAMWSAFESLASDMWTEAVNTRPDLFAVKVLRSFSESLPEGVSSRSISIGIAAKHNFDLRNCIGDIVAKGIDFTSLDDIRKAYKTAFDLDEVGENLLQSEELRKLVLLRNLIAHRSGIIDVEFKEKAKSSAEIGSEVGIDSEAATSYFNTVRAAGLHLLTLVDKCLKPTGTEGARMPVQ